MFLQFSVAFSKLIIILPGACEIGEASIRIGTNFQAVVPQFHAVTKPDLAFEPDLRIGTLTWDPDAIDPAKGISCRVHPVHFGTLTPL